MIEPIIAGASGSGASAMGGPFVNTGTWIVFAVILVPIYAMIAAWFIGKPGDVKRALMGVAYVVGITVILWGAMFVMTLLVGLTFYELPGLHNIGN